MSFQKDGFEAYLKGKGLKSISTFCYYLRRTQREFKADIDTEYSRDRGKALLSCIEAKLEKSRPFESKKSIKSRIKKRKRKALLQMRNSVKKYVDFRTASIPKEKSEFTVWDVMVGTVRDAQQLEFIIRNNSYYVPAHFITIDRLPIRYIALHEQGVGSEPGIHRYGEVIASQKLKRSRIPVPLNRNNGDEIYYYFKVRCWMKLSPPISIRDTHRGPPQFTSKHLLDSCSQSYQLFSVTSENDYQLMTAINKAFDEIRESGIKEFSSVYPINDDYTLNVCESSISIMNSENETLEKISVGSFFFRPNDGFKRFKNVINTQ